MAKTSNTHMVFGAHAVTALLEKRAHDVFELWILDGADERLQRTRNLADQVGIRIQAAKREQLDKWAEQGNHQGVVAACRPKPPLNEADLSVVLSGVENPLVLILDGVQDPHNLGACLRTAEAAGADAVIAPRNNAVGLTPVVRKISVGASEIVPFVQVTNLARTLRALQEMGVWLTGTSLDTEATLYDCDFTGPTGLVLGAEGSGLRRLTAEHCDQLALIPMDGTIQSLNVSVATGICLFEATRQRRK